MNEQPGTPEQPKSPKKRGKQAVDYTNNNTIFSSCSTELDYIRLMNKRLQYNLCLLFRAELLKRGWRVKAVQNLLAEIGVNIGIDSLNTIIQGNSYRWNLLVLFKVAYVLGIDIDTKKIEEAREYLRSNGRSVKDF